MCDCFSWPWKFTLRQSITLRMSIHVALHYSTFIKGFHITTPACYVYSSLNCLSMKLLNSTTTIRLIERYLNDFASELLSCNFHGITFVRTDKRVSHGSVLWLAETRTILSSDWMRLDHLSAIGSV